ncbi:sensor histidine kinase [Imhoffiella purpurea]|uniref:C4-dicarboxylate transport sensor protein DctB n=1 Tax=Imhoffiella purpurea TaxID=1249627 RepID=W9VV13_9GAMM|nr:ATP-binding protein [Imhoffiella purpurea]EXJ14235.1 two component sensor kinase [Imhoffiella purpurea]
MGAGLWALATWSYRDGIERLADQGRTDLDLYMAHLQGLLEKYEPLPELLATNPRLIEFLRAPGGRESIEALNRYLETINRISDATDTYLMDAEGLTLAASNWKAERPFVGRNFSFRPYFRDAMGGRLGRYFALGTTSKQRGYYFAYPVREKAEILGAVVVKIDISEAERRWAKAGRIFMVTDLDGVIFVSTRPEQRFHTLFPLDDATYRRIASSNRYMDAKLEPLGIEILEKRPEGALVHMQQVTGPRGHRRFLLQSRPMPDAGWQVHELSDTSEVIRDTLKLTTLAAALVATAVLIAALLLQHQRGRRVHAALTEEARATLERINLELEERVSTRTAELTRTNRRLLAEIDERLRAEQALREAQQALIQSAKLATLGQMSAGINHELNQPLAAIRTYADNGQLLLAKGRTQEVELNLEQILALTERMAKIGSQLKLFARKTSGELAALPLGPVVEGAARIAAPILARCHGELALEVPAELAVRANDVLLQQVLVNLLGNACQAIDGRPERRIRIGARRTGSLVVTRVEDTGPGIPESDLALIFEPFFTTKAAGEGLGLGLAISSHIATEMGGSLTAVPCETGACFELRLPAALIQPAHPT